MKAKHIKNTKDIVSFVKESKKLSFFKKVRKDPDNFTRDHYIYNEKDAVRKIISCVENKKKILIIGDYDTDGLLSSVVHFSLLCSVYEKSGLQSKEYISMKPANRYEGYGVSQEFWESGLWKEFDVILTTDLGVSIVLPHEFVVSEKELLVFDHHTAPCTVLYNIETERNRVENTLTPKEIKEKNVSRVTHQKILDMGKETTEDVISFINNRITYVNPILDNYNAFFAGVIDGHGDNIYVDKFDNTENYISAGQLAMEFWRKHYSSIVSSSSDLVTIIDGLLTLFGGFTVISDMMDLSYRSNIIHLAQASSLVDRIVDAEWVYDDAESAILHSILNKEKINKNEISSDTGLQYLLSSFVFLYSSFLSSGDNFYDVVAWKASPFLNSFGRMATTHSIIDAMIHNKPKDEKLNKRRKTIQNQITDTCMIQAKNQVGNKFVYCVINDTENNQDNHYKNIRNYYTNNHSDIFSDIVTDCVEMDIQRVYETISPLEGVMGSVCSRIAEATGATALVGIKLEDGTVKGSGRSKVPFIESGMATLNAVKHMGGHEHAFGATIDCEAMVDEVHSSIDAKWFDDSRVAKVDCSFELGNDMDFLKGLARLDRYFSGLYTCVVGVSRFINDTETKIETKLSGTGTYITTISGGGMRLVWFTENENILEKVQMKGIKKYNSIRDIKYIVPSSMKYKKDQYFSGFQILLGSVQE